MRISIEFSNPIAWRIVLFGSLCIYVVRLELFIHFITTTLSWSYILWHISPSIASFASVCCPRLHNDYLSLTFLQNRVNGQSAQRTRNIFAAICPFTHFNKQVFLLVDLISLPVFNIFADISPNNDFINCRDSFLLHSLTATIFQVQGFFSPVVVPINRN